MNRPLAVWIAFALCAALGLAALTGLSVSVAGLERSEAEATRHAIQEENIRLALWRLDSAMAPLLAREIARPVADYREERSDDDEAKGAMPGANATVPLDCVIGHRQIWPSSTVTPVGATAGVLTWSHFRGALGKTPGAPPTLAQIPAEPPLFYANQQMAQQSVQFQEGRNFNEYQARVRNVILNNSGIQAANDSLTTGGIPASQVPLSKGPPAGPFSRNPFSEDQVPADSDSHVIFLERIVPLDGNAAMKAVWVEDWLYLLREVTLENMPGIQAAQLDWPRLREWLVGQIADLVPGATLAPSVNGNPDDGSRRMAALPVKIVAPPFPPIELPLFTPIRLTLTVAWAFVVGALLVGAFLLHGILQLSERRAAFVSAVTHELRTPLTTFRMYSEMLASGMVVDPDRRQSYLETLHVESERLTHLVENVLSYARLERGRTGGPRREMTVGELLERAGERLAPRAAQAGMELVREVDPGVAPLVVRTDPGAVEQILFNLVDNACKYAASAADRRIEIGVSSKVETISVEVRDHGPGIPPDKTGRLFKPFMKSAGEAAHTAAGVGLGLALSRRLARALGGDLRFAPREGRGACFVLRLPATRPRQNLGNS